MLGLSNVSQGARADEDIGPYGVLCVKRGKSVYFASVTVTWMVPVIS